MEETLYAADIVVHASVEGISWDNLYDVQHNFIIKCVFKDVNDQLPDNLTITLDYYEYTSCSGPWPEEAGDYIMGLKAVAGGKFVPDEPNYNSLESATFEASDEKLESLLKLCGMQDPRGEMCPQHDDEDTDDTDNEATDDDICVKAEYTGLAEKETTTKAEYTATAENNDEEKETTTKAEYTATAENNDEEKETTIKPEYTGSASHTYTCMITIIMAIILYTSA